MFEHLQIQELNQPTSQILSGSEPRVRTMKRGVGITKTTAKRDMQLSYLLWRKETKIDIRDTAVSCHCRIFISGVVGNFSGWLTKTWNTINP